METMDMRTFGRKGKRQMYSVGAEILPQRGGQSLLKIMLRSPEG